MPAQTDAFDSRLDALYASLRDPNRFSEALTDLRHLFDAPKISFIRTLADGTLTNLIASGFTATQMQAYGEHYMPHDPVRVQVFGKPLGTWFEDDRQLDAAFARKSTYVNDFCPEAGIRWFRGGKIYEDATHKAFLSVIRPSDARPFDAEALATLDRLLPHLNRVTRLQGDLDRLLPVFAATQAAFAQVGTAMFVVDGGGRLRHANPAAEALLRRSGLLVLRQDRLSFSDAGHAERLAAALHGATRFPRQAASFCPNSYAPIDEIMQLRVLPLEADFAMTGTRLALVFVTVGPARLDPPMLAQMHGLTRTEAILVARLALGKSVAECADERRCSVATVRTHLASILLKTGTRSQAQLMSLVLAMPGAGPATPGAT